MEQKQQELENIEKINSDTDNEKDIDVGFKTAKKRNFKDKICNKQFVINSSIAGGILFFATAMGMGIYYIIKDQGENDNLISGYGFDPSLNQSIISHENNTQLYEKDTDVKNCNNEELISVFVGCFASALADNICNRLADFFSKCTTKSKDKDINLLPESDKQQIELEPLQQSSLHHQKTV